MIQPFIATLLPVSSISKQAGIKNTLADVVNNPLKRAQCKIQGYCVQKSDGTKASQSIYNRCCQNSTPDDGIAMALDEMIQKQLINMISCSIEHNSSVVPADVTGNISAVF